MLIEKLRNVKKIKISDSSKTVAVLFVIILFLTIANSYQSALSIVKINMFLRVVSSIVAMFSLWIFSFGEGFVGLLYITVLYVFYITLAVVFELSFIYLIKSNIKQ